MFLLILIIQQVVDEVGCATRSGPRSLFLHQRSVVRDEVGVTSKALRRMQNAHLPCAVFIGGGGSCIAARRSVGAPMAGGGVIHRPHCRSGRGGGGRGVGSNQGGSPKCWDAVDCGGGDAAETAGKWGFDTPKTPSSLCIYLPIISSLYTFFQTGHIWRFWSGHKNYPEP